MRRNVHKDLGRWAKRHKRAETELRKLKARLRYYDRRAAAMEATRQEVGG